MSDDNCHLIATEYFGAYRVGWYFPGDGEIGACLGDNPGGLTGPTPPYSDAAESTIASLAVAARFDVPRDGTGFRFGSMSQAKKAMLVAMRAIADAKAQRVPEPWEALALAAGWTPPRGR